MIVLPFIEFQTETAIAKEIPFKNLYNNIAEFTNFDVNALINSSSHNTDKNKVDAFAAKVSTNMSPILLVTNNNETKKNMSLLSKNTTTTTTTSSLEQLNNYNSNKSKPALQSGNHSAYSLPSVKTVLIVKGAALLRDKAYSPNPLIIHAQDSILWKNMDDVVHTVTSGSSFSSPDRGQEFDSGLLGGSYTHKFMKPGVYNYFCQIHPTMVGKIIVK